MEFKIEKNVPLPKEAYEIYLDKFWNKMEIGDSILLSLNEVKKLRSYLFLALRDEGYGLYKTEREDDLYRLWKIKERGRKNERKLATGTIRTYEFRKPKLASVEGNGKSNS
tara:strand:- start:769 stop:1101 length:333 start_codon:yes stop_codon:yes gene_type:complete